MPQAPSVAFIEVAADDIPNLDPFTRQSQISQLAGFGNTRAQMLGASGLSTDFQRGYELGLQTAREVIAGSPVIQQAGLDPSTIL